MRYPNSSRPLHLSKFYNLRRATVIYFVKRSFMFSTFYRNVVPGLCFLVIFLHGPVVNCQQKSKDFTITNPSAVGFDASLLNKIDTALSNGTFPNIHSVLIARNNKFVFEKYWPGKDEIWA